MWLLGEMLCAKWMFWNIEVARKSKNILYLKIRVLKHGGKCIDRMKYISVIVNTIKIKLQVKVNRVFSSNMKINNIQ